MWHVISDETEGHVAESDPRGESKPLGDPPTCPVDGCEKTITRLPLPEHVIQAHSESSLP